MVDSSRCTHMLAFARSCHILWIFSCYFLILHFVNIFLLFSQNKIYCSIRTHLYCFYSFKILIGNIGIWLITKPSSLSGCTEFQIIIGDTLKYLEYFSFRSLSDVKPNKHISCLHTFFAIFVLTTQNRNIQLRPL